MKPFTLPAWTKKLPDNAFLNSAEVAAIFGYSSCGGLKTKIDRGCVPEPDSRSKGFKEKARPAMRWSMGYLRKLEKEHGRASCEQA